MTRIPSWDEVGLFVDSHRQNEDEEPENQVPQSTLPSWDDVGQFVEGSLRSQAPVEAEPVPVEELIDQPNLGTPFDPVTLDVPFDSPYADRLAEQAARQQPDRQLTPEEVMLLESRRAAGTKAVETTPEVEQRSRLAELLSPPVDQARIVQPVEGGSQGDPVAQAQYDAEQEEARLRAAYEAGAPLREKMNEARQKVRGEAKNPDVAALQSFMDTARQVPGVKGNFDMVMNVLAARSASRISRGEGTDEDYTTLAELERMAIENGKRDGFWQGVYDIGVGSAPFMTAMGLTGGLRTAARQSAKKATGSAVAAELAAAGAGTINPAMFPIIAKQVAEEAAPTVTREGDVVPGEPVDVAVAKGTASTGIEVLSEGLGGYIAPALSKMSPKVIRETAAKIASRMKGPAGSRREAISEALKSAGIENAPVEWIEERASEIAHGATGLSEDYGVTGQVAKGDWEPAIKQSLQELVFFGALQAPGAVGAVADGMKGPDAATWLDNPKNEGKVPSRRQFEKWTGKKQSSAAERKEFVDVLRQFREYIRNAQQVEEASQDDGGGVPQREVPEEGGDTEEGGLQVPPSGQEEVTSPQAGLRELSPREVEDVWRAEVPGAEGIPPGKTEMLDQIERVRNGLQTEDDSIRPDDIQGEGERGTPRDDDIPDARGVEPQDTPPSAPPGGQPGAAEPETPDLREMLKEIDDQIQSQGRVVDDRLVTRRNQIQQLLDEQEQAKPEPSEERRESWQMTRDEWARRHPGYREGADMNISNPSYMAQHAVAVRDAAFEGKEVPEEVLRDYPDITEESEDTSPPAGEIDVIESPGAARQRRNAERASRSREQFSESQDVEIGKNRTPGRILKISDDSGLIEVEVTDDEGAGTGRIISGLEPESLKPRKKSILKPKDKKPSAPTKSVVDAYSDPQAFDSAREAFVADIQRKGVADAPDGSTVKIVPDPVNDGRYSLEVVSDGVRATKGDPVRGWSLQGAQAKAIETAGLSPDFRPKTAPHIERDVDEPTVEGGIQTGVAEAGEAGQQPVGPQETGVPKKSILKPKRISDRGQTAIPGLESEAETAESADVRRVEEEREWQAFRGQLQDAIHDKGSKTDWVDQHKGKLSKETVRNSINEVVKESDSNQLWPEWVIDSMDLPAQREPGPIGKQEVKARDEAVERIIEKEVSNAVDSLNSFSDMKVGDQKYNSNTDENVTVKSFVATKKHSLAAGTDYWEIQPEVQAESGDTYIEESIWLEDVESPAEPEPTDIDTSELSDIEAAMADAMDEEFAPTSEPVSTQEETIKPNEKQGEGVSHSETRVPSDTPQKPRKGKLSENAKKRKERTSKERDDALNDLRNLLKDKKITAGVDPDLVKATVRLTRAAINDGVSTFLEYAAWVADNVGESATEQLAPYVESAWRRLGSYDEFRGRIDDAGSVKEVLDARRSEDGIQPPRGEDLEEGEAETGADVPGSPGASGEGGRSGGAMAGDGGRTEETGDGPSGSTERGDEDVRESSRPGGNYRIGRTDRIGGGRTFSPKERFKKNVEAIKLLKLLEGEGRKATKAEQEVLVQYVGWGGLKQAFGRGETVDGETVYNPIKGWESEFRELRELLTEEEWLEAKKSIKNAHYTDPDIVRSIWDGLAELGFKGGRIVEPSAGTGIFFGTMPESIANNPATKLQATEIEPLSGGIAKQLYQNADIQVKGFQDVNLPDGSVDLFISNVPFGRYSLTDRFDRAIKRASIHNFFFQKAIKKTRPGGLVVFITSRYSMDQKNQADRKAWEKQGANLVGTVRLPHNAFKGIADTSVVSDIVILQKRAEGAEPSHAAPWKQRKDVKKQGFFEFQQVDGKRKKVWNEGEATFPINEYFEAFPEHIVGELSWTGTMQQTDEPQITVEPPRSGDIVELTAEVMASIEVDRDALDNVENLTDDLDSAALDAIEDQQWQEDHVRVEGDRIYVREDGKKVEIPAPYVRHERDAKGRITKIKATSRASKRMKRLVGVFDAAERLIALQPNPKATDEQIEEAREELNDVYDRTVSEFGPLSAGWNATFARKSSLTVASRLFSLENYDPTENTAEKAAIFSERTERPHKFETTADTAPDALSVSLNIRGKLDVDHVAEVLGKSREETLAELGNLVFKNHDGDYEIASTYLSGDVRRKLDEATDLAKEDAEYQKNVEALKEVQPEDLGPDKITAKLNSPWIPSDVHQQFLDHLLRRNVSVRFVTSNGKWLVQPENRNYIRQLEEMDWGTADIPALELIEKYLNKRDLRVWRTEADVRYVDRDATALANSKLEAVKSEFTRWVWSDADRTDRLVNHYNENLNNIHHEPAVGEHLTFPGMSDEVRKLLNPHQVNAVWRFLTGGNLLMGHVVGAGKTWTMAAAAMEAKRISGNPSYKTLITVPNHLVTSGQFVKEILEAYPSAKVLAATPKSLSGLGRRSLLKKIATGNYDIIVMAHSSFERIPLDPSFESEFIQRQVDKLEEEIRVARAESDRNYEAELEAQLENLREKLKSVSTAANRDDKSVYFNDLNVNTLMVDEAHEFKNLAFSTKMNRVPGVNPSGSVKAFDMHMKTSYFNQLTNEKNLLFATGTPVANAIAEVFTMQRYLQPSVLESHGLESFDAWASTFAEEKARPEIDPAGGGMRMHSRLSEYVNIPELTAMFRQVIDVQTADMLEDVLNRPKVKGGKAQKIESERNEILEEIVESLQDRADDVRNGRVDKSTDNMLTVITDGRKAATDIRLIDPSYPDLEGSKINLAIGNIHKIWKDTEAEKSTQIVWLDVTSPTTRYPLNLYREIVDKLRAKGIPAEEIAVMHDYDEKTKSSMFDKMNRGEIRILLGSTKVMGTGVNVQKRLIASHHLDVPWRPDELEQRDGRILRRGNTHDEVEIFRYISKGSFDAFMWDKIEQKTRFIRQALIGSSGRSMDASEAEDMSAAEMKAAAADDPNLIRYVEVNAEVQQLESEQRGFQSEMSRLRRERTTIKSYSIPYHLEQAEKYKKAIKTIEELRADIPEGEIRGEVDGETYTSNKEFGEALMDALAKTEKDSDLTFKFNGVDGRVRVSPEWVNDFARGEMHVDGAVFGLKLGESADGNVTRIRNAIEKSSDLPEYYRNEAEKEREKVKSLEKRLQVEWPHQDRLSKLQQELARLTALVQASGSDKTKDEIAERASEVGGRPIVVSEDGLFVYEDNGEPANEGLIERVQNKLAAERRRNREERIRRMREQAVEYEWTRPPAIQRSRRKKKKQDDDELGFNPGVRQKTLLEPKAGTDPIAASDIIKTWERDFDVPIRIGKIARADAAGIYKWLREVVRLRDEYAVNLAVAIHEVGHHLDKTLDVTKNLPDIVANEIMQLDYEENREDLTTARREGWAEFLRYWVTDEDAHLRAPAVHHWFENVFVPQNPEIGKKLHKAREHARRWSDQGAFERAKQSIPGRSARPVDVTASDVAEKIRTARHRITREWQDQNYAFKTLADEYERLGGNFDDFESPYELKMAFDFTAPAHSERALLQGVHTVGQEHKILGPSLLEAVKDLKSNGVYDEAQSYAIARFTVELSKKMPGYNSTMDLEDAEFIMETIDADPDKKAKYEHFANTLTEFNNALIRMLHDAGAITNQDLDRVLSAYDHYVPLLRVTGRDNKKAAFGGSGLANLGPILKRRKKKGSDLPLVDIVEASIQRSLMFYNRALKAQVVESLIRTVDPNLNGEIPLGKLAERLPPDRVPTVLELQETLDTLVDEGLIREEEAEEIKVVGILREYREGRSHNLPSEARMAKLGEQYDLKMDDYLRTEDFIDELLEVTEDVADAFSTITIWRPAWTPRPDKYIVRFIHNGEPVLYQLDPILYDTVTNMDRRQMDFFTELARSLNRVFKTGAVAISTAFGGQNIFRDWRDAQARAKNQGVESVYTPFEWLGRYAWADYAKRHSEDANEFVRLFQEFGGELTTRLGYDAKSQRQTVRDLRGVFDLKHSLRKGLREVVQFVQMTDLGPRLAEFAAVMNNHGYYLKKGKIVDAQGNRARPPRRVIVKAITAAGDATVNFKPIGSKGGRFVDAWIPFTNPAIQSKYRLYQDVKTLKNPTEKAAQRVLISSLAAAAAAAAYWAYVQDDDDDEREDWLRGNYWVFTYEGQVIARIAKSRDYRFIDNMTIAMLEDWKNNTHDGKKEQAVDELIEASSVGGGGVVREGLEQLQNWDYQFDAPIEPDYIARYEPWRRGMDDEYIAPLSKVIGEYTGKMFGFSPVRVEHLLRSTTGGAYRRWHRTGKNILNGEATAKDLPVLSGIIMDRDYHKSVNEFYGELNKITMQKDTEKLDGPPKKTTLNRYEKATTYEAIMSDIRAAEREKSPEKQRDRSFEPYIIGLARDLLGKKPLDSFPNPLYADPKTLPMGVRRAVGEYLESAEGRVGKLSRMPRSGENLEERTDNYMAQRAVDEAILKKRSLLRRADRIR